MLTNQHQKSTHKDRSEVLIKDFDRWADQERTHFMRALFGGRDMAAQRHMMG